MNMENDPHFKYKVCLGFFLAGMICILIGVLIFMIVKWMILK